MDKDKSKQNSFGNPLWRQGIMLFSEISSWIVVPIVGALILGKFLDQRFKTEDKIFLSLAGIAFAVTCYGIIKIAKNYLKQIKNEYKEGGKNSHEYKNK